MATNTKYSTLEIFFKYIPSGALDSFNFEIELASWFKFKVGVISIV